MTGREISKNCIVEYDIETNELDIGGLACGTSAHMSADKIPELREYLQLIYDHYYIIRQAKSLEEQL